MSNKKDPLIVKSKVVHFRVSKDNYDKLNAYAKMIDMSISDTIIKMLDDSFVSGVLQIDNN